MLHRIYFFCNIALEISYFLFLLFLMFNLNGLDYGKGYF